MLKMLKPSLSIVELDSLMRGRTIISSSESRVCIKPFTSQYAIRVTVKGVVTNGWDPLVS